MQPSFLIKLSEALRSNDSQFYTDLLENFDFTLDSFKSEHSLNIFHEISNCRLNEKYILPFLEKTADMIKAKLSLSALLLLLNAQCDVEDKYSPLHLSILRGNMKLAKKLLELGADPSAKTELGRNALHICAEVGMLGLFLYIRDEYGLALEEQDKKGFTPLHVAIGERREDMALLILSLCKEVSVNVHAALQMAVNTGSYKITRHLLLHRREESLNLKTLDKSSDDKDISKLLRRPNASKRSRCYFWLLNFGLFGKYCSLVYEVCFTGLAFSDIQWISITAGRVLLLAIVFLLLIVLNRKDPGYEVKDESMSLTELYCKYIPEYICPYCELKKHKGTKHCNFCQKCVRDYDHHCKWIDNCVGRGNLKVFVFFLVMMTVNLISEIGYFLYASFVTHEINWAALGTGFDLGYLIDYLSAFGILVNFIIFGIVAPVAVKTGLNLKKRKNSSKKVIKEPLLATKDYSKGFRDMENEATSDTASMFIKETYDSNSESASSSTFISQFFSNR